MKKQLVFSKDGNLYLDTGMTQDAFSKARLADRLSERGVKAERSSEGNKEAWTFSKWAFSGSRMPDRTVLLEGFLFSGLPLSDFFGKDEKEKEYLAGARVCSASGRAAYSSPPISRESFSCPNASSIWQRACSQTNFRAST